jgi:hypothetical protein
LDNAYHLARVAALAYEVEGILGAEPPSHRDMDSFQLAFPHFLPFSEGRIEGFVASNAANAVLAFSGTNEMEEWLDHLQYAQVAGYGGRAHGSVARAVDGVYERVLAGLYDADVFEKDLWITGHSFGGAMAMLAAWRLAHEGFSPHCTCSFGAPAILDEQGAAAYGPALYRFVNDGDWIPHLKWPRLDHPFTHAGQEIYLLRSGAISDDRYPAHLARRLDRIDQFLDAAEPRMHGSPYDDHTTGEYLIRIGLARRET